MARSASPSSTPAWIEGLRMQLKLAVGTSWNVSPMRDKAKLFARFDDGSRKSMVLPCLWLPASSSEILRAAETMHQLIQSGLSFDKAKEHVLGPSGAALPGAASPSAVDLVEIWERFGDYKVRGTGQIKLSTWQKDYRITGGRLREVQSQSPASAKDLLRAIADRWDPGSRRREIAVQHMAAMLRWAIEEGHLSAEQWTPPPKISRIVGPKPQKESSVPLKDQQILELFDALPKDPAGRRWLFALQLVASFGLRPVELLHLDLSPDGKLWCRYQKTSGGGRTKPRELRALHPEWGEEWKLIQRLADGEELPPLDAPSGPADSMRKYLIRQEAWKLLRASSPITPYSFRHGYALRAHEDYGLSARVTAELMGHSVATHNQHYSQWADSATIDAAIERGLRHRGVLAPPMVYDSAG